MKRVNQLLCLTLLVAHTSGCATTGYWADRRQDLTDVAHVDVTMFSVGVAANAGPAIVGLHRTAGSCGDGGRVKIGLGGVQAVSTCGQYAGVVFPISRIKEKTRSNGGYGTEAPPWGSVGLDIGLILGLGVRFDVVELADLVLGLGGIDIIDDDVSKKEVLTLEQRRQNRDAALREQKQSNHQIQNIGTNAPNSDL